ncbi:hypothetical protein OAK12_01670, partial [Alphaproteobacteria bacterium]|nr:hypothetical protein [Alphaproteobacteria bacterium]
MELFYNEQYWTWFEYEYIFDSQFYINFFLPDVVNSLFLALIIFLSYYFKLLNFRLFAFLLITSFLPWLVNGVIFPINYMPDQYLYTNAAYLYRNFIPSFDTDLVIDQTYMVPITLYEFSSSITETGKFFAYLPMPFIHSVTSISIINRLIFTLMVIFLYNKRALTGYSLIFFLLFPSLILYSNLALKEMLIVFLMVLSLYSL